jgi:aminoacyl tRNA synthase complex-interacting multifunctional protein 1
MFNIQKMYSMRGVKSEGMVLAATGSDGKVELLNPPAGSQPGDRVYFETFEEG